MKSLLYNPPVTFLKLWKSGVIGIAVKKNKEEFFFSAKPILKKVTGLSSEVLEGVNKMG
jgi:hypothetical protein